MTATRDARRLSSRADPLIHDTPSTIFGISMARMMESALLTHPNIASPQYGNRNNNSVVKLLLLQYVTD